MQHPLPTNAKDVLKKLSPCNQMAAIAYLAVDAYRRDDEQTAQNYVRLFETRPRLKELPADYQITQIQVAQAHFYRRQGNPGAAERIIQGILEKADRYNDVFNFFRAQVGHFCCAIGDIKAAKKHVRKLDGYTALPVVKKIASHYVREGLTDQALACTELLTKSDWQGHLLTYLARQLPEQKDARECLTSALALRYNEEIVEFTVHNKVARAYARIGLLDKAQYILRKNTGRYRSQHLNCRLQIAFLKYVGRHDKNRARVRLADLAVEDISPEELKVDVLIRAAKAIVVLEDLVLARTLLRKAIRWIGKIGRTPYGDSGVYYEADLYGRIAKVYASIGTKRDFARMLTDPNTDFTRGPLWVQYLRYLLIHSPAPTG